MGRSARELGYSSKVLVFDLKPSPVPSIQMYRAWTLGKEVHSIHYIRQNLTINNNVTKMWYIWCKSFRFLPGALVKLHVLVQYGFVGLGVHLKETN